MDALRIGSVPYLNGKPLIAWFDSPECDVPVELSYAVPSELARRLRRGELDVALVSTFELFGGPGLEVVPGIAIAADGAVKSVRLFSTVPFARIERVALDTSSLTSAALTRILLAEIYGISPEYRQHPPDLESMLAAHDAGLIIGDLKLFCSPARHILDLGEAWKGHTGLAFVYAGWLVREERAESDVVETLTRARDWGCARLDALSVEWARKMDLPLDRVRDYFFSVMQYHLDGAQWQGLAAFQERCLAHNLVSRREPLRVVGRT